ncbi:MAG TPA: hypothetical protein VHT97_06355 [Acidimicrobiales bacterium]|jgi:hypothetical protein|nr:hypothetical protein [Acidimicrobiales bacterium]
MSRIVPRRLAVLGGTLGVVALVGVGLALADAPGPVTTTAAIGPTVTTTVAAQSSDTPAVDPAATTTAPTVAANAAPATAPAPSPAKTTPSTVAKSAATTAPPTTKAPATAAPAATTPPAAKVAPGQRINPTTADVAAAIAQLHQRIPLFAPTDAQLRAFADAVCASFDQGQTQAQVQQTMQTAVSYVQGASLSAADAQFAVGVVVKLRCPGYLP